MLKFLIKHSTKILVSCIVGSYCSSFLTLVSEVSYLERQGVCISNTLLENLFLIPTIRRLSHANEILAYCYLMRRECYRRPGTCPLCGGVAFGGMSDKKCFDYFHMSKKDIDRLNKARTSCIGIVGNPDEEVEEK